MSWRPVPKAKFDATRISVVIRLHSNGQHFELDVCDTDSIAQLKCNIHAALNPTLTVARQQLFILSDQDDEVLLQNQCSLQTYDIKAGTFIHLKELPEIGLYFLIRFHSSNSISLIPLLTARGVYLRTCSEPSPLFSNLAPPESFYRPCGLVFDHYRSRVVISDWARSTVTALQLPAMTIAWQYPPSPPPPNIALEDNPSALFHPRGLFMPDLKHVFVLDSGRHRLVALWADDGEFAEVFGCEGHGSNQFNNPFALIQPSADNALLWISDQDNHRVMGMTVNWPDSKYCVHSSHVVPVHRIDLWNLDFFSMPVSTSCIMGLSMTKGFDHLHLTHPSGLAYANFDKQCILFVADCGNDRILAYDATSGEKLPKYDISNCSGRSPGQLISPQGMCFDEVTDILYVCELGNRRVSAFQLTTDGVQFIGLLCGGRTALSNYHSSSNTAFEDERALKTPISGACSAALSAAPVLSHPIHVAIEPRNREVWVTDLMGGQILIFSCF
jgi:hypothetical protein